MLYFASTVVLVLVAAGLYCRRRQRVHLALMLTAFVTDLALVLYIEAGRGAVEKVVESVRPVIWFHAAVSVGVLLLYLTMLTLGLQLLRGRTALKATHRRLGMSFVALRVLNYMTSFVVVERKGPALADLFHRALTSLGGFSG